MLDNNQEIPILVTYYTNSKILAQKEFGSFAHFGSVLTYFDRNIKKEGFTQLKPRYIFNNKEIDNNDILINLIQPLDKSKKIINANISIEIEEKNNISDKSFPFFSKILQPKFNSFGIYVFTPKDGTLSLEQYPTKTEIDYELNKINENSAYCNSTKELFISGGIYNKIELSNLWVINNEIFSIKKLNMNYPKSNHSMIYIKHRDSEKIFFAGGKDLRTFYYDIKKNNFSAWGDMNFLHIRPALFQIDNYLFCFDTSPDNKIIFEKTNLDDIKHRWEKFSPNFEKENLKNFTNTGFGVTMCNGGKIIFCGGDNVYINTYIYDVNKNLLSINNKSEDILFSLSDKNFYKINNNYSIALPSSLDDEKDILIVNKNKNTLRKINFSEGSKNAKIRCRYNIDNNNNDLQYELFGNINIDVKTKDLKKEKNKNKDNDNKIDINSEISEYNNVAFYEKKYEADINKMISENFKNISTKENDGENYIINNDNFTNYKRPKKDIYTINSNFNQVFTEQGENDFDDFEYNGNSKYKYNNLKINKNYNVKPNKVYKKIELKFEVDDDGFFEAEGNNFIYDANVNKFKDIKNKKDINNKDNKIIYTEMNPKLENSDNVNYNVHIIKHDSKKNENNLNSNKNLNNNNISSDNGINTEKNKIINDEINNNVEKSEDKMLDKKEKDNNIKNLDDENNKIDIQNSYNLINSNNNNEKENNEIQNEEHMEEYYEEENIVEQNDKSNNSYNNEHYNEEYIEDNNMNNDENNEQYEEQNEQYEEQIEQYEEEIEQNEDQYEQYEENNSQFEEQNDEHFEDNNNNGEQNIENNNEQYEEQNDEQNEEEYEKQYEEQKEENNEENNLVENEEQNQDNREINNNENIQNEENIGDGAFEEVSQKSNEGYNIEENGVFDENNNNENDENNGEENYDENNKKKEENEIEQHNEDGNFEEIKNEEDISKEQEYYEHQDRDKFEHTIIQSLGEDIIQIENHPNLFYYDENNFCDYYNEEEKMK